MVTQLLPLLLSGRAAHQGARGQQASGPLAMSARNIRRITTCDPSLRLNFPGTAASLNGSEPRNFTNRLTLR